MDALKVLVVDDSRYVARLIQAKLAKLNWVVITETNPRRVMDLVRTQSPDVLLLDLALPAIDGLTLLRQLRRSAGVHSTVPVIVHSARNTREDVVEAIQAGADDYVVKPASIDTILDKVVQTMERRGRTLRVKPEEARLSRSLFRPNMGPLERIQTLLAAARQLKVLPQIIQRTLEITGDSGSGARDLAQVVQSDSGISALVLKRSNTVEYAKSEPIVDVNEAVIRIGFMETKTLVLGLEIARLFSAKRKSLGFSRLGFWEHSLAVASFARHLAAAAQLDEHEAFTAGLLHDIGKIVLDEFAPDDFDLALEHASQNQLPIHAGEAATIRIDHTEVGLAILKHWGLPESLRHAVRRHHASMGHGELGERVPESAQQLVRLVALANDLAKAHRIGHAGDEILGESPAPQLEALGIEAPLDPAVVYRVHDEVDGFREFMGISDAGEAPLSASVDDERRVFLVRDLTVDDHPVETFLGCAGIEVEPCSLAHAEACLSSGDTGTLLWELEPGSPGAEVSDALARLSVPVILIGDPPDDSWSVPENSTLFARPVSGYHLLLRILGESRRADPELEAGDGAGAPVTARGA